MTRVISLIFFLVVLVLGLFFGVLNADSVKLDYYWGSSQVPLSLIIVAALFCGAVLGVLSCMVIILRLRHRISRLRREVRDVEKEVKNLRTLPIKDEH